MAIGVIMFLPAISHIMPFPLYYMDPMRLVLLGVYFVNRNHKNAYLLAIGIAYFFDAVFGSSGILQGYANLI